MKNKKVFKGEELTEREEKIYKKGVLKGMDYGALAALGGIILAALLKVFFFDK